MPVSGLDAYIGQTARIIIHADMRSHTHTPVVFLILSFMFDWLPIYSRTGLARASLLDKALYGNHFAASVK